MDSLLLLLVSHILFSYIFQFSGAAASAAGDLLTKKKKKDEKQRHVLKKNKKERKGKEPRPLIEEKKI